MYSRFRLVFVASALLAFSVPALAQTPPARRPARTAAASHETTRERDYQAVVLLPPTVLDAITPLQPDQMTKVAAIHERMRQDVKAATGDPTKIDRAKITEIRAQAETAIHEVLTADQNRQIEHIMSAVGMLQHSHAIPPATLKDVKLTQAQWDQIVTIEFEEHAKMKGESRDQKLAIFAEFKSRVDTILTPVQNDIVAKFLAAHPPHNAAPTPGH